MMNYTVNEELHKLESLETGSVILECKEGPFVEHEVEGMMAVKGEGCD